MLTGYCSPFFTNMATSAARLSNPRLKALSCGSGVLLKVTGTKITGF
jgi:hypothetical protein